MNLLVQSGTVRRSAKIKIKCAFAKTETDLKQNMFRQNLLQGLHMGYSRQEM